MEQLHRLVLECSGELTSAPDIIDILPLGTVRSTKGSFVVDEESHALMCKHMAERAIDIVVDYEHQTLEGVRAPAAGWIKALTLTDHSIAARVEWTPAAQEHIQNKEYRYCSPVVLRRASDNKVVQLHSLALTNTPAIDGQFALVNKEGENTMDIIKTLAQLLGLPETATEEQVLEAVTALVGQPPATETVVNKAVASLLGLEESADTATVSAAIMALKTNSVPAAEHHALAARLARLETAGLIETALESGRITPAQREWAEQYVLSDRAGFEKFIELAPAAVPMGGPAAPPKAGAAPDADTTLVCKTLGLSPDDFEKYGDK